MDNMTCRCCGHGDLFDDIGVTDRRAGVGGDDRGFDTELVSRDMTTESLSFANGNP
jgi:hypothetical protein